MGLFGKKKENYNSPKWDKVEMTCSKCGKRSVMDRVKANIMDPNGLVEGPVYICKNCGSLVKKG